MATLNFNQMLINNADYLKPFALSLTRDNETAKDLMQETLFRALSNHEKYNAGTNIKAWMYTIMRNIFINDYRKKARQNTVFDNTPNDYLLDYNQHAISNTAETNLSLKDIQSSVDQLPEIFKNPFVMYFEGYKYNEIAEHLNEPLGTIKSRIHFARKLLKEQLSRY
ncbi:MAG: RNA polymerase sigma factor [Ferruginibacter sp.]|nr:RNA polymerase sigma factor [Ferruginibacter sp.]